MKIKDIRCKKIKDSRGDWTIEIEIKTNCGKFKASSPQGKSTGKFEVKAYKKDIDSDIKSLVDLKECFNEEDFEEFEDLEKIEEVVESHVGGNTQLALEYCVLKGMAKEKELDVWQLINPEANLLPKQIGNVIGGGRHSDETKTEGKKPDFQEFLVVSENYGLVRKAHEEARILLNKFDESFKEEKNDENAWMCSLNEKCVLDIMYEIKSKFKVGIGLDIAASEFYKRNKYYYENPKLKRDKEEQIGYVANIIKNYDLLYIEDPFDEQDFKSFGELLKLNKDSLIVGDDLTVTNSKRLKKAIKEKSINGIIIKPNQCGSLMEVNRVVNLCREKNIKMIFSHRSGETEENILADLAFGFQSEYIKIGVRGKERESKINRLIEISRNLKIK